MSRHPGTREERKQRRVAKRAKAQADLKSYMDYIGVSDVSRVGMSNAEVEHEARVTFGRLNLKRLGRLRLDARGERVAS